MLVMMQSKMILSNLSTELTEGKRAYKMTWKYIIIIMQ